MAKNILGLFLEKLLEFPLWVKQFIFLKLYQNLQAYLSEDFISTKDEDIFQLYVPVMSFIGKTELEERKKGYDANVYNFLAGVNEGHTMLEISMNNFWTMEEVAKYYIFCLEQDYFKTPDSVYIYAMAGFMSGKFRTGEYFKRVGRIDVDQLEKTIIAQKEFAAQGNPKKMAEIMISMGFLTEKETHSLLVIKEESKKRFILDGTVIPKDISDKFTTAAEYKEQIARLVEQNNKLKDQLTKVLAFVKKNV